MIIQYYVFGLKDLQKDIPALIEIEMDISKVTQSYYIYTVYYIVYVLCHHYLNLNVKNFCYTFPMF